MGHRNLKVGNINSRARGAQPARRGLALAISAGLAAMCVAVSVHAQVATPGSEECPVVDGEVRCSGEVSDVIAVTGGNYHGLLVENLTADIVVTSRPAIEFTGGTPDTTIRIVDADNLLRLTTPPPLPLTDPERWNTSLSAVLLTARNNNNFSLVSDIDIVGQATCPVADCAFYDNFVPSGITVRGSGGRFSIENLGEITLEGILLPDGIAPVGIVADVFDADRVFIRNAGSIDIRNGVGILATADNRYVDIVNDGSISTRQDAGGISGHGISLNATTSFQIYADGYTRPDDASQQPDLRYRIVNNGLIHAENTGGNYSVEIQVWATGRTTGEIENNGTISGSNGIYARQSGDLTIVNNGLIDIVDGDVGIWARQELPPASVLGDVPITRLVNGDVGAIRVSGLGAIGIEAGGGIGIVDNRGLIEVTGDRTRGVVLSGSGVLLDRRYGGLLRDDSWSSQLQTISNSGRIVATGLLARALEVERDFSREDNTGVAPDQRTVVNSSGLFEASGAGAVALSFMHSNLEITETSVNLSEVPIGTVDLDLTATSIVRGGSGVEGAGIVFFGGERHTVRNAGLITADSGIAIVGGGAAETIDNSGRIEGSVSLGAGDDRIISRGGVFTGALDGGTGSDVLQIDVTTGSATFADRFGGAITGFEWFEKTGAGTFRMTSPVFSRIALRGGTLATQGDVGAMAVDAADGTTLEASGRLGAVTLANGAVLTPGGEGVATIEFASLALSNTSVLHFDLGAPGVVGGTDSDLINVSGDLVLDGRVEVNALPDFGEGVYRLINYGGALTDNGLVVDALPGGFGGTIQTGIAQQVNLMVGSGSFWDGGGTAADGRISGGSGTWDQGGAQWTNNDGSINTAWMGRSAIFQGTAGTVTIAPGGISATGLQFAASGYTLTGGALTLDMPGTIRVGDGTQAGAAMSATIDSVVAGSGGVDKTDFGTLVLTGSNTYTGGTRLSSGTLEVASDASLGAASGGVDFRGGNLRVREGFSTSRAFDIGAVGGTFDTGSGSARYAGLLSGSGAFNRSGTGRFNFTGDGSGYTGTFGSGAGVFHLTGVLGGTLDLAANATLSGTGRANDLRIAGRLAPGNSIGTLVADGDVTFLAGSTFEVEVAADGRSDLLQSAGTANLQGGMVDVRVLDPQAAYTDGQQYTFLSAAGGLTGTFAGVTDNSAFLDFALGYTGTSAQLTLTRVAVFPDVALTWNQRQSSTGLRDLAQTGDALAAYNALLVLDASSARNAFDAASGEIHAGNQQAMAAAGSAFNRALLRQPVAEGPGLWLAGVHGTGKIEGDGNAATLDHRVQGVALGYGSGASTEAGSWTLGGAIGTTDARADVDGRNSRANGDAWHVGVYGSWSHGPWEARAALGYMDGEADVTRGIAFGALARSAKSKQAMEALGFSGELAWRLSDGKVAVAPVLTVDALRANFDATRESGAGALDLSPESQRHEQLEIGAGVRLSGALGNGGYELRAVYAQDVAADRMAERSGLFAGSPTAFTVRGPEADKERVRLSAGVSYPIATDMSLGLHYDGVFSGSGNTHGATARFDWRF